jgi:cytochrome c553
MKRRLWRMVLIGGLVALAGFVVAATGIVPLKASSGHWAITQWVLRFGMKRSIATHSLAIKVPDNLSDRSLVLKGAGYYEIGCRSCHGSPGLTPPRIAARMLPLPPALGPRIRESNPKKLFYVVKHGMKFTGMPAWPSTQRDDEVWAMVAFLLQYPALDAAAYRRLIGAEESHAASADAFPLPPSPPSAIVQSCANCHGHDGRGRANDLMPTLAGQREPYLRAALEAYAAGHRHSGMMEPVAGALTPDAIAQAAGYFSRLRSAKPSARDPETVPAEVRRRGELIATEGIRAQRIPACIECHGPGARRGKPEYPRLAGQPAAYLELQLTLFREGRRGGSDHAHLMKPVANRLKPEQARDVAGYFSSLDPAVDGPTPP